jgi:hypothetical protein
MLDLLGAVELTAGAALAIAAVAISLGRDRVTRAGLALALGGWFAIVVALAATGALTAESGTGILGVGLAVAIPLAVLLASLWTAPGLRAGLERAPLVPLTAVHAIRLLGVSFVLLYAAGRLPAPFAPVAGWGDIAVGAAAVPVAWLVARRAAGWRRVLLAWNVVGLADLATAVTLAVLSAPGPLRVIVAEPGTDLMSTLPWLLIPGFLVPVLAATHLVIFYRLWRERPVTGVRSRPADERKSVMAATNTSVRTAGVRG